MGKGIARGEPKRLVDMALRFGAATQVVLRETDKRMRVRQVMIKYQRLFALGNA